MNIWSLIKSGICAVFLMLIGAGSCLVARPVEEPVPVISIESSIDGIEFKEMEDSIDGKVLGVYVEDMLKLKDFLMLTPEEAEIPEECVRGIYEGSSYKNINVEGNLFGEKAHGRMSVTTDDGDDVSRIREINLYSEDLSYIDAYEEFEKIYGEAIDEGIEPYAKSNGGAVDWAVFATEKGKVKISQGQENSWMAITIWE